MGILIERIALEIQLGWLFNIGETLTLRKWLIHVEYAYENNFKGVPCFWVRGYFRLLGFNVGAGVYYKYRSKV